MRSTMILLALVVLAVLAGIYVAARNRAG